MNCFHGLSAFPVTPADDDGRVDIAHLQRLIDRLVAANVSSIGALGSTGSYMYLSSEERAHALKAAVEAAGTLPVIAGIGAMRTSWVVRHARDAEAAGAAGLLIAPVSYLPLTDDDVLSLVRDVAGTTDLPICIYNNPGTTHFNVSEDLLLALAEIPTVKAVKNPAPAGGDFLGQLDRLREKLPTDFSIGYSGDATIAGALLAGADAWYSVLAGTLPDIAMQLWDAREDPAKMHALNEQLTPLWDLFAAHGGIRVIHEAAEIIGLGPTPLPRPLLPLPAHARAALCEQIESLNPSLMGMKCL
ncbi:MAG: dihydrodipicolinate synthase family protein [Pseudomonadota bacterium]